MAVILIGGGARSGKSRYALELARARSANLTFIATATASDDDMAERIARHRADRSAEFRTIEEPLEIAEAIHSIPSGAIVVDCLTLWLANLMSARRDLSAAAGQLVNTAAGSSATVIFVTNEVGCGIHPETPLGREFRDRAGILNQRIGSVAAEIYWMVFGHPMRVK